MKEIIRDSEGKSRLEVYIDNGRLCLKMTDYGNYVVNWDKRIIPHLIKALKKVEKDDKSSNQ